MAGAGKKTFQVNEVLSAADVNQYLMDQSVMRFADSTARSSAIGTPSEGMVSYLDDTDQVEVFDGSQWVNFTGDITQITAGTALTGGGTAGDVTLDVDISALATAQAGTALSADGETLNVDESELFTGGTAGYTALSNGTAGLSYQPVSHNYIINGAFDIWQRGTSFTAADDIFTADRWFFDSRGNTVNITQEQFTPAELAINGFGEAEYYLRLDSTGTATASNRLETRIEDVRTLAGQEVTFSFWAKADAGDNAVIVRQRFNSGSGDTGILAQSVTFTSSWQRYSYTFTMPSISGKTIGAGSYIEIRFRKEDTVDQILDIWGVQLEAGSIATPFKRHAPSLQGELAACQRYYHKIAEGNSKTIALGQSQTSSIFVASLSLPTTMRTVPSIDIASGTDYYNIANDSGGDRLDDLSIGGGSTESLVELANTTDVSGATPGESWRLRTANANAYVALDAEL